MKNTYTVPVKLNEDTLARLIVICEAEGRTPSGQFVFMLRNYIAYYEKTHGRITPERLRAAGTGAFAASGPDVSD